MAENITSLPSKKSVITRRVLIIGGAVVGAVVVAAVLKQIAPEAVVVETITEAAS